jgi:hypothetical protein
VEGFSSYRQMYLFISSQHVSPQIGQHRIFLKKYANDDRLHINHSISTQFFVLVNIESDETSHYVYIIV